MARLSASEAGKFAGVVVLADECAFQKADERRNCAENLQQLRIEARAEGEFRRIFASADELVLWREIAAAG
jgi:hypothetical protein